MTGPLALELYAASTADDTDFTATLVDMYPNGRAVNLVEGIVRARLRDSLERPSLIEPGRAYCYLISLGETSNLFRAGHRIRLEVSSSNFPRFSRNLNSGDDPATASRMVVARQTVLHDAAHPSCLLLHVIPR